MAPVWAVAVHLSFVEQHTNEPTRVMSTTHNLTEKSAEADAPVVLHPTSTVFDDSSNKKSSFNARKAAVFIADLNAVAL